MPQPSSSPQRRKFNFFDATEKPTEWLIRLCGWSSIVGLAAIFLFIFREAAPMVTKLNWVHFFTSPRWIPNPGEGNDPSFGALALIVGTFTTTFIALLVSVPVGLGAAVYISEFAQGKIKETLKIIIELLAAIPSIVWGFIGLMVLGPIIVTVFSSPIPPGLGRFELIALAGLFLLIIGGLFSKFLPHSLVGWPRRTVAFAIPLLCIAGAGFLIRLRYPVLDDFITGPM